MKIEIKSNKIEKRGICDFEGRNLLEFYSKGVLFYDFFLNFWKKFGANRNSSFRTRLIGWKFYLCAATDTATLKINQTKYKKENKKNPMKNTIPVEGESREVLEVKLL